MDDWPVQLMLLSSEIVFVEELEFHISPKIQSNFNGFDMSTYEMEYQSNPLSWDCISWK